MITKDETFNHMRILFDELEKQFSKEVVLIPPYTEEKAQAWEKNVMLLIEGLRAGLETIEIKARSQ
jgi:hypothetical protein